MTLEFDKIIETNRIHIDQFRLEIKFVAIFFFMASMFGCLVNGEKIIMYLKFVRRFHFYQFYKMCQMENRILAFNNNNNNT